MTTSAAPVAFDITAVKRQLQELQELHASGALSREFYEEGRTRLERRILDWVLQEAPAAEPAGAPAVQPLTRPSWQLWATLAGVVLLVAVLGYSWVRSLIRPLDGQHQRWGCGRREKNPCQRC